MREFAFDLATPADNPAIQRLLAENPVPGRITVSYERTPDYFDGCAVMGGFTQVLAARHLPSGELAGIAIRALRPLFINGGEEECGYIGQLRVARRFRGRWLTSGGFRLLGELHRDGRARGYYTTIIEGNREAAGLLVEKPRGHYPVYRQLDLLHTLAMPVKRRGRVSGSNLEIRRWTELDPADIVTFMRACGAARQFFPAYTTDDFHPGSPATLGLAHDGLLAALRGGRIVGVMGLWDQSGYKQSVIRGYSGPLRWGRPLYNLAARLSGLPPLPAPGGRLRSAYASFIAIEDDDSAVFTTLLERLRDLAADKGHDYLLLGLCGRNPLLPAARRFRHLAYTAGLYSVCWEEEFHARLDRRCPHVEIAVI